MTENKAGTLSLSLTVLVATLSLSLLVLTVLFNPAGAAFGTQLGIVIPDWMIIVTEVGRVWSWMVSVLLCVYVGGAIVGYGVMVKAGMVKGPSRLTIKMIMWLMVLMVFAFVALLSQFYVLGVVWMVTVVVEYTVSCLYMPTKTQSD